MNIELYNEIYLASKGQHAFTSNSHNKYSAFIDTIASKPQKNNIKQHLQKNNFNNQAVQSLL